MTIGKIAKKLQTCLSPYKQLFENIFGSFGSKLFFDLY